MRSIALQVWLLIIALSSRAQADSLNVIQAGWDVQKIAPGIKLKQYWFNQTLFNSNQNISILEIKRNRRNRIDVEADSQALKITSAFGTQHDAIAALNGTFFDMKKGGSVDYIRVNGKIINSTRLPANGSRTIHQKAAIVINHGRVDIIEWDGSRNWEDMLPGEDIMVTGPLLLRGRQPTGLDSTALFVARHPRTAVAIKADKILLITVDGRNEKAAGMSLFELARFLRWIKADHAINLDGGGSTTLWIRDQPGNGVVNYPSDNKKWDYQGERPVANVLLVKRKK